MKNPSLSQAAQNMIKLTPCLMVSAWKRKQTYMRSCAKKTIVGFTIGMTFSNVTNKKYTIRNEHNQQNFFAEPFQDLFLIIASKNQLGSIHIWYALKPFKHYSIILYLTQYRQISIEETPFFFLNRVMLNRLNKDLCKVHLF